VPPEDSKSPNRASLPNTLLDVLGVGAGLAAYAYAAGGAVEYLRFKGSHLPASQALSLLSSREILATGLVVALTAPIVWLLIRIALWARKEVTTDDHPQHATPRPEDAGPSSAAEHTQPQSSTGEGVTIVLSDVGPGAEATSPTETEADGVEHERASLADFVSYGFALSTFAGIVFLIAALLNGGAPHLQEFVQVLGVAGGVGGVMAAIAWVMLPGRQSGPGGPTDATAPSASAAPGFRGLAALPARWMVAVLLTLTLVGGASVAYFVPLSLPGVVVRLTGGRCIRGLYLARDSSSVTLVDGKAKRLLSISAKELSAVEVGGRHHVATTRIEALTKCPAPAALAEPG
jgi:hypothetical protein